MTRCTTFYFITWQNDFTKWLLHIRVLKYKIRSYVTVILYLLHSSSFSPRRRFVFQTEISGKYIVLVLISLLFYFFFSLRRGDQSTVFCIVSFDFNWSRSPKIRHPSALVCRCGLAHIRRFVPLIPLILNKFKWFKILNFNCVLILLGFCAGKKSRMRLRFNILLKLSRR